MHDLPFLDAAELERRLPYPALIEALRGAFGEEIVVPERLHGDLGARSQRPEQCDLLVMPAWRPGGEIGVKLVTLMEHNGERARPRIQGLYVLFDGAAGTPAAVMDAATLTTLRTAAASALAASYLARTNATSLLVCGSGRLARALPRAYAAVLPLQRIAIWARRRDAAAQTCAELRDALPETHIEVAEDLEAGVRRADIVSSAVPSRSPFLEGAWLEQGTHLDLIGSYRPDMHEADATALRRASVFVDTRAGVLAEAGEFISALAHGAIQDADIRADLTALCAGAHAGRQDDTEITLFKSVGTALEDLTAARLAATGT